MLFFLIHNVFATLQDVSSDALAVDLIPEEDLARANGFMFASKGFGFMFSAIVLGGILSRIGLPGRVDGAVARARGHHAGAHLPA